MEPSQPTRADPLARAVREACNAVVPPTDDDLWARLQSASPEERPDAASVTELYRRWSSPLAILGRATGLDEAAALGVVNRGFENLLRRINRVPSSRKAFAYLWRTIERDAWRESARSARRTQREQPMTVAGTPDRRTAADPVVREELVAAVDDALRDLTPAQRTAVVLKHVLEWTREQVAEVMGIKPETVKTLLDRAKQRLSCALDKWRGVVPAAGGTAVADAMLAEAAQAGTLPQNRAAELAAEILTRASAAPGWSVGKVAAVVFTGLALGGAATAGWALIREQPEPVSLQDDRNQSPPHVESLEDYVRKRNRERLHSDVLPQAIPALQKLVPEGRVEVGSTDVFITRVQVSFKLHQGKDDSPKFGVRIDYDTASRDHTVERDLLDDGNWRPVNPDMPLVLTNPLTGQEIIAGGSALKEMASSFDLLPSDDKTHAVYAAHVQRWREAVAPYMGTWFVEGTPGRRYVIRLDYDNVLIEDDRDRKWLNYVRWGRVEKGKPNLTVFGHAVELSPDRQRLRLGIGERLSRKPGS